MPRSKRLLVTGSSGFIGSNIVLQALSEGYEVVGLDIKDNRIKDIDFIKGDIREKAVVEKAVKGVDYVMHLAAVTSNLEFESDLRGCYETNVAGFLNLIDAAHRNGCKKFAYASSAVIYKDRFSEDAPINVNGITNHYAKSKVIGEMLAGSYQDLYNLQTMGMRLFNNYGTGENEKGNYASIPTLFLKYKQKGEKIVIYGDGTQSKDKIYVTDTAKIALKLLEKGTERIYNVGTGVASSYNRIADIIGKERIYVKNPLSTYQYLTRADTTRLIKAIGNYKFISIEEGIKKLADYYKIKIG